MSTSAADDVVVVKKHPWGGWNKIQPSEIAPPRLLEDVMSQELAAQLQEQEEQSFQAQITASIANVGEVYGGNGPSTSGGSIGGACATSAYETLAADDDDTEANDVLLAQMLQLEFDIEADAALQRSQDHYNAGSKVSVSFERYRNTHPYQQEELYSDQEEAEELHIVEPNLQFGKKGTRGTGKNVVTKHDPHISGRKNATNAMDKFSLDMDTGDGDKYEMSLSNKVYNKLKIHSISERKRAARLHEKKDQSTATQAVDQKTRLQLFKMLNSGLLEEVHGVISIGKESAVLHATGGEMEDGKGNVLPVPEELALKVFKTTLAEFKNREKYVKGDFRLANEFKKQNPRKIMRMWAEKEMLNLKRMAKFGIMCPEVIKLKKHILVMEFVGKDQVPAPKLKDAKLSGDKLMSAYHQVIDGMINLYKKCSLVHADLSEYNLLWHNTQVYFIDVSQAVDLSHPLAHEFLLRDCHNIQNFFTKQGVSLVQDAHSMFNMITGMKLKAETDREFLQQIQEYEKEQFAYQLNVQRKEFAFDHMFDIQRNDNTDSDSSDEEYAEESGETEEAQKWN